MKIIVMCLPRTGSTSLRRYIESTNLDYKVYNEPFNSAWPNYSYKDVIRCNNLFIKGIFWDIPKDTEFDGIQKVILKEFRTDDPQDFDLPGIDSMRLFKSMVKRLGA